MGDELTNCPVCWCTPGRQRLIETLYGNVGDGRIIHQDRSVAYRMWCRCPCHEATP